MFIFNFSELSLPPACLSKNSVNCRANKLFKSDMNLQVLQDAFINNPRLFQLADRITLSQPQRIYLKNLQGSTPSFIVSAIFNHPACGQLNHLIVCEDAERAAYFHNDLENLTGALDLFYFPSSFKNRKNFRLLNSSHVMLRAEALMKWSAGGNKKIMVTHPEALFEKVVMPNTLSGNVISIKSGDVLDVDGVMEKLVNYGFARTDFVYEPGQFALRGGILDIYSFGNEKPYRIELFGNDVDSIRIFDPESQLSERKLLQVTIIPNVETQFDSAEKISLMDFLPSNTVVWMQDWEITGDRMLTQEEDLHLYLDIKSSAPKPSDEDENTDTFDPKPSDFITTKGLEASLQSRHIVEFGYRSTFNQG